MSTTRRLFRRKKKKQEGTSRTSEQDQRCPQLLRANTGAAGPWVRKGTDNSSRIWTAQVTRAMKTRPRKSDFKPLRDAGRKYLVYSVTDCAEPWEILGAALLRLGCDLEQESTLQTPAVCACPRRLTGTAHTPTSLTRVPTAPGEPATHRQF